MTRHSYPARGSSLLEVLVTIVIMTIGLLGLAKLQVSNLHNNQSTLHRAEATFLANDILDSMRVLNNINHDQSAAYVVAPGGSSAAAGPSGVAIEDVSAWKDRIAQALPDGDGHVEFDADSRTASIWIEWNDRRSGAPDCQEGCSCTETRPACFKTEGGV
ncbi:type IV pilus modification protein PilV [Malikia spinosa]|uniref:Type IV pilus modification protein PilV n=1 Tax=Malikia spinosa TaxID=86180 RepID=A0A2S9KGA0_9BURK|nr:type IV pilus modification protein PilV [Malikia spinosa]MYZ51801.1 type IV pilus modification protein PilV [Malikia spinosa]OGB69502.1 MAG: type IV pilus modification protein PilV [Burkholderiales bacterium RIFOXYC12_FULL_65_23]PRD69444.1 type IV pilus modification protein PilV [Malikia spinosa]